MANIRIATRDSTFLCEVIGFSPNTSMCHEVNELATAYFRMLEGKTALYDMTDVIDMGGDVTVEEPVETLPAETEPAPTEPVEIPAENDRSFSWWLVIVIVVLAGAIVVLVIISKPKKGRHMK